MNLEKLAIIFSPNKKEDIKVGILSFLGFSNARTYDKYLGLPTMIGKNKKRVFVEINDRVWKRINGWKRGQFSIGSREILIN